jgi:hypothetical protein
MVTRVRGLSVRSFREVCKGENAAIGDDEVLKPVLVASSKNKNRKVELQTYFSGEEPGFFAGVSERRGRLRIYRSLSQSGKEGDITFGTAGRITISPPNPFSGTAEYLPRQDGHVSWLGTIAGTFPGIGDVSLAGPLFSVYEPSPSRSQ